MAGNEKNFRSSITLTTTRSTGASVARTAGGAAVDGHAAFIATNPVFGKITRRRHPRYIVAMNATTFRTIRFIVHGGGLRSHRRWSVIAVQPRTRDNHAIPCVL